MKTTQPQTSSVHQMMMLNLQVTRFFLTIMGTSGRESQTTKLSPHPSFSVQFRKSTNGGVLCFSEFVDEAVTHWNLGTQEDQTIVQHQPSQSNTNKVNQHKYTFKGTQILSFSIIDFHLVIGVTGYGYDF